MRNLQLASGPNVATARNTNDNMLVRLRRAREVVAALVVEDPVYLPIFVRLEAEIAAEEARGDPVAQARAIASAHSAIF